MQGRHRLWMRPRARRLREDHEAKATDATGVASAGWCSIAHCSIAHGSADATRIRLAEATASHNLPL